METNHIQYKTKTQQVLIIDDEMDICFLLSGILKQRQFKTVYVNSLSEANVALSKMPVDLIFLDNHLPDGLGLDFINNLRKNYPKTKIIMITAHDSEAERSRAHQEGVAVFIAKPFTREMINKAIDIIT